MPTEPVLTMEADTPAVPKAAASTQRTVSGASKDPAAADVATATTDAVAETSESAVALSAAGPRDPLSSGLMVFPYSATDVADVVATSLDTAAQLIAFQRTFLEGVLDSSALFAR